MKNRLVSALLISAILAALAGACSKDKSTSSGTPPAPSQGRILLENDSEFGIYLLDYTHNRGVDRASAELGIILLPAHAYYLHNLLDQGGGQMFSGGDKVSVHFISQEPNPDDPSQPLYERRVEHTINGSVIIQVKSGGDYVIRPE